MPGTGQRDRHGVGAHGAARALAGGFCLALAVTVTQAAGVLPADAQPTPTAAVAANTILAWGDNSFGQFGNGTIASSSTPVAVRLPAGTTVTAIAGSDTHSLALTSAGTVLAWGANSFARRWQHQRQQHPRRRQPARRHHSHRRCLRRRPQPGPG